MPHFGSLFDTPRSAPQSITVTASPFTYTAPLSGAVIVNAGTVSLVELGRAGTFTALGLIGGVTPVWQGDQIRVTYAVAPTMTLIPQ